MVPVKIECGCGQRYAFDVEPLNGRMPAPIKCPSCGMDGTAAANESIDYMLKLQPPAASAAPQRSSPGLSTPVAAAPPLAAPAASNSFAPVSIAAPPAIPTERRASTSYAPQIPSTAENTAESSGWKWWYYILAGILIGIIDGWYIYETGRLRYIKGLLLSVFLILVGIWDFNAKRRKR